jgi:hypothetical protein
MGIASTLMRSWENGASQPESLQLKVLADLFGYHADVDSIKEDAFAIQFARFT